LVSLEIGNQLKDEIERLSQAFGIGVIKLYAYPYESKVVFPSKYRELDFQTIDKLCKINQNFSDFVKHIRRVIAADDNYREGSEKELSNICDKYFDNDSDIKKYCNEKNVPYSDNNLSYEQTR
jgi:hypothetical protein